MDMAWDPKVAPKWWTERKLGKPRAKAGLPSSAKKRPAGIAAGGGGKEKKVALSSTHRTGETEAGGINGKDKNMGLASARCIGEIEAGGINDQSLPLERADDKFDAHDVDIEKASSETTDVTLS